MPRAAAGTKRTGTGSTARSERNVGNDDVQLRRVLDAMQAMRDGNFRRRLPVSSDGVLGELAAAYNDIAERQQHLASELSRVRRVAGRDGKHTERLRPGVGEGGWASSIEAANGLVADLVRPTGALARVVTAVSHGDLSQRMDVNEDGRPLAGRAAAAGPQRQRAGGAAVVDRRRDHPGDPRGRHRGQAGRPGPGPQRRRQLARPHRRGQHDVVPAHRPGPRHRPGHDGGRQRRPLPHGDGRGLRRDGAAEGHRRPDGRPAVVVRGRGHPRVPRGRHRGPPGRAGRGARRRRHLARPHRLGEHHGVQPDQPGPRHLLRRAGGRPGRPEPADHGDRPRRGRGAGRDPQLDDRDAADLRRRGHPGGPRGRHRGHPRRPGEPCRAWPAPGATSPTR